MFKIGDFSRLAQVGMLALRRVEPPREDHLCFRTIAGSDLAAAVIHEGQFEGVVGPIQSLLRWVGLHDHASVGALRELHLSGPAHDDTPGAMGIIELQIPIAPIAALPT